MTNPILKLTDAAAGKVKELMTREENADYLRVFVTGGGCAGLNYGMTFASRGQVENSDHEFVANGVPILVDEFSAPLIQGMEVDWEEGLMGTGFKMSNPNARATCACNQSFCA